MNERWKREIIERHRKKDAEKCTNETHDGVDCSCMKKCLICGTRRIDCVC